MQTETATAIDKIKTAIALLRRHIGWSDAFARQQAFEAQISAAGFWDDQPRAQKLMREKTHLDSQIDKVRTLQADMDEHCAMLAMATDEGAEDVIKEAERALQDLAIMAGKAQLDSLLSGEADAHNCFVEIHPGAGGTEAQDWAAMLLRMYHRWAEARGFKIETIDAQDGEEAGIKSVTMRILGMNAYGWMKTESGVHRLVRISPYDSSARRHTSFASVWVYPEVDETIELVLEDKDLRIDSYRASGAGGQHVNTTDSAIRITHIPTNIVVQCQSDRSQHRNKATALTMLKARLYERELQKREQSALEGTASKAEIGWGNQIRSYVLHPYQMVKDLRTHVETGNIQAVLDGDLDEFIEASLASRVGSTRPH